VTPRAELFPQWQKDAARFGLTAWSLEHARTGGLKPSNPYKLVDSSFRKLSGVHSTFTKSDLLRETALLGQISGVSIDRLTRNVDKFIQRNPEIVPSRCGPVYVEVEPEAGVRPAGNGNGHRIPKQPKTRC
jgi:hypothetical protein